MRTTAIALVVCLTAATLPAAEPSPPSIGSRVRALGAGGFEITGTLTAYGPHDITIATRKGRDATTIGLERIERLQVPGERDRLAGFGFGVLAGLAVAIGATFLTLRDVEGCVEGGCLLYAIYYSFLTVPVGAIVGTAAAPRRWRDLSLPPSATPASRGLGFRIAPARGGARFALTYGF